VNAERPIRVLVADDSSTSRELLAGILRADGRFELVGMAVDGLETVAMTRDLRPDVVMMDIHMPGIDGVKATRRIMEETPVPIVVVTGSVVFSDVAVTLNALEAGALAVLRKPSGPRSPDFEEESRRIISTVKAMAGVKVIRRRPRHEAGGAGPEQRAALSRKPVKAVAIATSTGGPAALRRILAGLPGSFPVPILVVQHISKGFAPGLAMWLEEAASLRVKLGEHGELLVPGCVYIAPDGWHMGVSRESRIVLSDEPPVEGFKPSGTFLFESIAASFGDGSLAVVLTGMGQDGVAGLRAVRDAGGRVLVQDEASSVVFGMPRKAIEAGLADAALPLDGMADRILGEVGG